MPAAALLYLAFPACPPRGDSGEVLVEEKKSPVLVCPFCASLLVFIVLAGCGKSYYFGGRALPPSGILNRVLIAVQNPGALTKGSLQIVDAYYDIRHSFNDKVPSFSVAGYSGGDPQTIQNMPEEQAGAVYGAGDGSYALLNYGSEKQTTTVSLPGASSSVYISRDQRYVFAASQTAHTLTVQDRTLGAQLWVECAQRLSRLHQPQRVGSPGLRAGQQPGLQRL